MGSPIPGLTSVPLLQDDDLRNNTGYYAEWMPYQLGQAKAAQPAPAFETKTYTDGTTVTGPGPFPDQSPSEQAVS